MDLDLSMSIVVMNKLLDNKVHRVFLVDESGKPSRVITLTDVILYFFTANLAVFYPPADS